MAADVVEALKRYGGGRYRIPVALDEPIEKLRRDNPFAFLVGAVLNKMMRAEKAWEIPYHIHRKGELDSAEFARREESDLASLLASLPVKPHYWVKGGRTLKETAELVMQYGGNASGIWEGATPREVEKRLRGIFDVGPGISAMTVGILHDDFEAFRGHEQDIDVKADRNVVRVFKRVGFIEKEDARAAVEAARQLNPQFPGALNPAFNIGRNWCHRRLSPNCTACPLTSACPKLL